MNADRLVVELVTATDTPPINHGRTALVLTALVAAGAIATSGLAVTPSEFGNQLTGTWNVTVNRLAPLPPLESVRVFTSSGAMIEMANESHASCTAQYGAWERVRGRLYAATGSSIASMPRGTSWAPRRSTGPSIWGRMETLSST